jgi:hypothetical protein
MIDLRRRALGAGIAAAIALATTPAAGCGEKEEPDLSTTSVPTDTTATTPTVPTAPSTPTTPAPTTPAP